MIATVYFHGPAANWAGKGAPDEITANIATVEGPWLWLVRLRVKQILKLLNVGLYGYVIKNGDTVIECRDVSV